MKDIRLCDQIESGQDGDVVLFGFPRDEGVERNGGRPGARYGPEKFRAWMRRYGVVDNPEQKLDLGRLRVTDAEDVGGRGPLEEAHAALSAAVSSVLQGGGIPFVVGGGNDQSYPNASALLEQDGRGPVGVINIDAHLDVRPLAEGRPHSGSSFRQLLEDSRFDGKNFIEFAAQGAQCSREHAQYIYRKNGRILWLDEVQGQRSAVESFEASLGNLGWKCPAIFVSFDLDSVMGSEAPGVSCPGVLGLTAREALSIAQAAGRHPSVSLFDLSEFNPQIEEERTGRLAVAMFYYFCLGVASRRKEHAS